MAKRFDIAVRLRDSFSRGFKIIKREVGGLLVTLTKITGVSAAVSAALGAISGVRVFTGALSSAATFEEQLDRVQATSNATAEELAALEQTAKDLGATTRFTATEAAQGFEELTRSGQSASDAIATIPAVLAQAQANSIDLARSAQIVTTSLNQFKLGVDEASNVTDVLTAATQNSAQNIEQLARALEQSGPVAFQAGLSIQDTAALIGKLADAGFRGEKGGTALRNALSQIQDPASRFRRELTGLGIDSTNFVDVLVELAGKGDEANTALRALGLEAAPAITALVNTGADGILGLIQQLEGASGAAQRVADIMDSNLSGAIRSLGSAFDGLRINLVQPLLEPIQREIRLLASNLREFAASKAFAELRTKLVGLFELGAKAVKDFAAEIDFGAVIDRIIAFVDSASENLKRFGENAKSVSSVVSGAFAGIRIVVNSVDTAISTIVGTTATAAAAVGRLQVIVLEALGASDETIEKLNNSIQFFDDAAKNAFERAKRNADETRDALGDLGDAFDDAGSSARDFKTTADEAGQSAERAGEKIAQATDSAGLLQRTYEALSGAVDGVRQRYAEYVDSLNKASQGEEQALRSIEDLREEYSALQAAGLGATREARDLEIQIQRAGAQAKESAEDTEALTEAYSKLGIDSQDSLDAVVRANERAFRDVESAQRAGKASIEDVRRAFIAYAQSALAASKQSTAADRAAIESKIRLRAQVLGVTDALAGLGDTGEQSLNRVARAADKAAGSAQKLKDANEESAESAGGVSAALGSIIDQFALLSSQSQEIVENVVERIAVRGRSVGSFLKALARDLKPIQQRHIDETKALETLIATYESGQQPARDFAGAAASALSSFKFLDEASLDKLRNVLQAAQRDVERLRHETLGLVDDAERRLARLEGREDELELLDQRQKIAELEARAAASRDREEKKALERAIELERKILAIKEENARKASEESKQREAENDRQIEQQSQQNQLAEQERDIEREKAQAQQSQQQNAPAGLAGNRPAEILMKIQQDPNTVLGQQLLQLSPLQMRQLTQAVIAELQAARNFGGGFRGGLQ